MRYFLTYFMLLLFLCACEQDTHSAAPGAELAYEEAEIDTEAPRTAQTSRQLAGNWELSSDDQPAAPPASAPRIIYTGRVVAEVAELDSALQWVGRLVTAAGGYVSDQSRTNQTYRKQADLTIRVPADRLSSLTGALPNLVEQIDEESLNSDDVTAEWIDLESRLATKREVRDRYVEILRKRAVKVEDILAAEDKIRVITEEIEAREGRLRYLRDQVQLATLHLSLYEPQTYRPDAKPYAPSFFAELGAAFVSGARWIRELALICVAAWPLWLLLGLGWLIWRRWRSRT